MNNAVVYVYADGSATTSYGGNFSNEEDAYWFLVDEYNFDPNVIDFMDAEANPMPEEVEPGKEPWSGWAVLGTLFDRGLTFVGDRYAQELNYEMQRDVLQRQNELALYDLQLQQQLLAAQSRFRSEQATSGAASNGNSSSNTGTLVLVGVAVAVGVGMVVASKRRSAA